MGARTSGMLLIGLVGAGLAACSSSGRAAVTTTAAPSITTASAPATTTSTIAVTSAAATTSPTTAAPTTTTTIDPKTKAEADIRAAINLVMMSFSDCLVAMPQCKPESLAVARTGPLLARNIARINEWQGLGYAVTDRERFRYVIESIGLSEPTQAKAVVCYADGSKLVRPHAGPDGSDVVINDAFGSGRDEWTLRLEPDGVWRAFASTAVGSVSGNDQCGG